MADQPDNVLSYSPPSNRWAQVRQLIRRFWYVPFVIGMAFFLVHVYEQGPNSVEIRLDSGDVRYCWYGIPLKYRRMREPQRSKLLALAARSPAVQAKWVVCFDRKPNPESNPLAPEYYYGIAAWCDEDPNIARWAMDDVVDRVEHPSGLPKSGHIVFVSLVDMRACKVNPDWRDDEDVKWYCVEHGYAPPPVAPTPPAK